jgi:fructose-specific phosphotransferase system IIC component
MAETVSHIANFSLGSTRASKYTVTMGANSATADVLSNLGRVAFAIVTPINGASHNLSVRYNSGVANTAIAGNLAITSGTSAGVYSVLIIGPNGAN